MDKVIINYYRLETPFENTNAGFSRWAFCRDLRNGERCFIKEFLSPVYPLDSSPYDESARNRMRLFCQDYEKKMTALYTAINEASDGNIVRILSFFRFRSKYYIVTRRVNTETGGFVKTVGTLGGHDRQMLCLALCHAIMSLHRRHIVHADLKPENLLLERTPRGRLTLKMIDFDGSFFEGDLIEELMGDQVYFAPESVRFMQEETESSALTCKLDVFAAGLLMHQILAGELPRMPSGDTYVFEAALNDHPLVLSEDLPYGFDEVIRGMLQTDPDARWSMDAVFERLHGLCVGGEVKVKQTEVSKPTPTPEPEPDGAPISTGAAGIALSPRIRVGKGLRLREDEDRGPAAEAEKMEALFHRPKGLDEG